MTTLYELIEEQRKHVAEVYKATAVCPGTLDVEYLRDRVLELCDIQMDTLGLLIGLDKRLKEGEERANQAANIASCLANGMKPD